jgi:hypothetical protein
MVTRALALLLCSASLGLPGTPKVAKYIGESSAGNSDLDLKATIYADGDAVNQALGSTLDGHYVVVRILLTPKSKFTVDFDNFMLRTDKDGEKSHPFKPTQIAGDGALVVSGTAFGGDETKQGNPHKPVFSAGMGGMGSGTGNTQPITASKSTMQESTGRRNPLLNMLDDKMLPEKETEQPVEGMVYFPMEKQKVKDLELIVTTPSGKLSLRFK